jgi:hypothetical protein
MSTETNTKPVDDEATATEDLNETPRPKPLTTPVTPRTGVDPDGNYEPNGTGTGSN